MSTPQFRSICVADSIICFTDLLVGFLPSELKTFPSQIVCNLWGEVELQRRPSDHGIIAYLACPVFHPTGRRQKFRPRHGRLDQQLQSAQVKLKPLKTARQDLFSCWKCYVSLFLYVFCVFHYFSATVFWTWIVWSQVVFWTCFVAVRTGTRKDGIRRLDADSRRVLVTVL